MSDSSWENVQKWYDGAVGEKGHYYHQELVLPGILRLLDIKKNATSSLLDLACGQGILARSLPSSIDYVGMDASSSLIKQASRYAQTSHCRFLQHDLLKPFPLEKERFHYATILLALQNVAEPFLVFKHAYPHLKKEGRLLFVINHPCFRIPRQSSWHVDEQKKLQYRRVDRYMTPLSIPIAIHPGQKEKSPEVWTFHFPLSSYVSWLGEAGFVVEQMEEWCSQKKSSGKAAVMENRARKEFPLFLAISARKK